MSALEMQTLDSLLALQEEIKTRIASGSLPPKIERDLKRQLSKVTDLIDQKTGQQTLFDL